MWTRPAAHRKSWKMEAGHMWTRHAHRHHHTTLLTCGNTCTNTINENTGHTRQLTSAHFHRNTYCFWKILHTATNVCSKKNLKKQSSLSFVESNYWITRGPSFWSARDRETERERGRTERDLSLHQDVLSMWDWRIACQNCVLSTCRFSHSTTYVCACTFAHVQYLCITTTSKQSASPAAGMWQHLRGVQWEPGGVETGYWQKQDLSHRRSSHENSLLAIFFNLIT